MANMVWFVLHLVVREAQSGESSCGMDLITQSVARLGRRGAVIVPTVSLDHEAEIRPIEVDLEAVDRLFCRRQLESRCESDWDEEALQLGVGEQEGVAIEQAAEGAYAGLTRVVLQTVTECLRVDQSTLIGLVDRSLQPPL